MANPFRWYILDLDNHFVTGTNTEAIAEEHAIHPLKVVIDTDGGYELIGYKRKLKLIDVDYFKNLSAGQQS